MTGYATLSVRPDDRGVVFVALNRPEKRNAISAAMIAELTDVALTIGSSQATRAVVLSGAGPVFCAGGDLDWMKAQIATDRDGRLRAARELALMMQSLNEMPVPLIGRLHGAAFGGGVGLACICDVAIAAQGTRFGFTETMLGLIPATIGPYVLARIGEGNARRVFMSARIFEADEARALGIVAKVVAETDLDAAVEAEIAPYLSAAPGAVAAAKSFVRALGSRIDGPLIEESIRRLADIWEGEEAAHGIDAFLSGQRARWMRVVA